MQAHFAARNRRPKVAPALETDVPAMVRVLAVVIAFATVAAVAADGPRVAAAGSASAAIASLGSAASKTTTSGESPHVTQTRLPNGLRIAVVEDHALPLAQVAMWYGAGSVNDPPGRSGTAHALEHMMFRGTRALSGAALNDLEARLGADTNADTDYEYTHFYQTVPSDAVDVAMHVESDRMRGLLLRAADWNLERGAVLAELAGYAASDVTALEDAVRACAYRGTAYEHEQAGTASDVARITVSDLRRVYDAGYAPNDALLVVTGDVDPAHVVRAATALFGPIRAHAADARPRAEPLTSRGFVVRTRARAVRVVDLALELHGMESRDALAEELAVELLEPEHGVLDGALVEHGPCASYDADEDVQRFGGLVHVVCRLDRHADAAAALRTMRAAFTRLARSVSPGTVAEIRRLDRANTDFSRDALAQEADLWGEALATVRLTPPQADRRMAAVPDAAVIAVLRRWATPVGAGIASGRLAGEVMGIEPARPSHAEHVPAPAALERIVFPRWARVVPLPQPSVAPVDAFTLPDGLRLYVAPRRGSQTAYVRARNGDRRLQPIGASAASLQRRADRHAIVLDVEDGIDAHGYAHELPEMLAIVHDAWRSAHASAGSAAWIAVTGDVDSATVYADVARAFTGAATPAQPAPTPSDSSTASPSSAASPSPAAAQSAAIAPSPSPSPSPSASPSPARPPASSTPPPRISFTFGAGSPEASALFVQPAPRRDDPDFAAMSLLNAILGWRGDFDTRLMRDVRVRRGLVYGAASFYDPERGRLMLYFDASSARFAAARAAIRDVLQRLRTGPIAAAEVDRARRKLNAAALRAQASPDGVLDVIARAARERRAPDDIVSLAALYGGVSVADVERVARTRLDPDHMAEIDEGAPVRGARVPVPR